MKMERRRYEFVLEAETPIAHHETTIGNMSLAMRRKVRTPGGWTHVPIITADTMRHGMREAAAYALLEAAGLLDRPQLSEAAIRLLFAGGTLTGRGNAGVVKLDQYHQLVELVPSMSLFGGCSDNRVVPGQLIVEDATLVCTETAPFVPVWAMAEVEARCGIDGARAHLEEVQRTRMDPTLQPQKVRLMADGEQVRIAGRLQASEQASADGDAVEASREKSSMMPRSMERIAQGSMFSWAVEARLYDELQVDTYHVAVGAWLADAWAGGKRGTGHGKLRVVAARHVRLARVARAEDCIDTTALGAQTGELFRAHVRERAERIASFLAGCNA